MDKKLTDSEIVKALECCNTEYEDYQCPHCPLLYKGCKKALIQQALDLINRLQAENENLKDILYDAEGVNLVNYWHQQFKIAENGCRNFEKELKTAKAEAYKEFAELVHCHCQDIINQPHNEKVKPLSWKVAYEEFDEYIDNLLKEMVGDSDEVHNTASPENEKE